MRCLLLILESYRYRNRVESYLPASEEEDRNHLHPVSRGAGFILLASCQLLVDWMCSLLRSIARLIDINTLPGEGKVVWVL